MWLNLYTYKPIFSGLCENWLFKNVAERINKLNHSKAVPFGFRLYATYDVETQSADKVLHKIIDKLNADLRSVDTINDKVKIRKFYLISPEDGYELLEAYYGGSNVKNLIDNIKKIKHINDNMIRMNCI